MSILMRLRFFSVFAGLASSCLMASTEDFADLNGILGVELGQRIQTCFRKGFRSPSIYKPNWCNRNTRNLYRDCFTPDVRGGFVFYLLTVTSHNDLKNGLPFRRVFPLKARQGAKIWGYHTFLVFKQYVFDLDFTDRARVVDIFTYFKEMFGVTERTSPRHYVARIIPAEDYLKQYSDLKRNWDYYINDPDELYPLEDILRYLVNQRKQGRPVEYSLEQLSYL